MKKVILGTLAAVLMSASVFAGDAAFFDDIGFSDDGKYYLFGQYGKQDKTYKAWAEIYTVDVAANDFVRNEIYKTKPSDVTSEISGKDAYEELKKKSTWKTSKYNAKPASVKTLLFLRESEKKLPTEEIVFKDFENSSEGNEVFYHVRLVPEFFGSGKNVKSKFYINVVQKNQNGEILSSMKVGTPDCQRKGISAYQIDKIFTDASGKSLVFIVQKTLEDDKGTSIRYMVETAVLSTGSAVNDGK